MNDNENQVKRTISVAVMGHVDHGKTTLLAALLKTASEKYGLSKAADYNTIKKTPEERTRGVTINVSHQESLVKDAGGNTIRIIFSDCPGHADYIKQLITGAANIDYVILTIAAAQGLQPQTIAHIALMAPRYRSKPENERVLVIVITRLDEVPEADREEVIEIINCYIEELKEVSERGINEDIGFKYEDVFTDTIVLNCCAGVITGVTQKELITDESLAREKANAEKILDTIMELPVPHRPIDSPARMEIEAAITVEGRGTVLTGSVKAGIIKVGDELCVHSLKSGKIEKVVVTSIETFHKPMKSAAAGENVGIIVRGNIKKADITRGDLLAAPNSVKLYSSFTGLVYIADIIGKKGVIQSGAEIPIAIGMAQYTASIIFLTKLDRDDKEEVINLVNRGAKMNGADANSQKLKGIIGKSGFGGASKESDHEVIVKLCNEKTRVPVEAGDSVVGLGQKKARDSNSKSNALYFSVSETF